MNKFLAKIASDLDKPRGFAVLDQDEARTMLANKPVGFIFGVGPATQERLVQRGFRTIADLQRADEIELMRQFPSDGRRLWRLARGIDDRNVVAERGAKTISAETTFENDITRFRDAGETALAPVGESLGSAQEQRSLWLDHHAETQDRRLPPAHPLAIDHAPTQLAEKIFAISRECWRRKSTAPPSA